MFRLFNLLPDRTARTRAACVSFSFVYNVKQRGTFRLRYATDNSLLPVPFSGMPADWSADRILNFHETVGANRAPQALSERVIGAVPSKCQAPSLKKINIITRY
jgi:hypothetical protein